MRKKIHRHFLLHSVKKRSHSFLVFLDRNTGSEKKVGLHHIELQRDLFLAKIAFVAFVN